MITIIKVHSSCPSILERSIPELKITKQWTGQDKKKKSLLMESVTIISNNKIKDFLPNNVMNGGRWSIKISFVIT
ncbi:hypothetical protein Q5O89_12795 [Peribacillus frigoritolerans]|nr:hypothetical protein [Peribacillus frigoritolerans]